MRRYGMAVGGPMDGKMVEGTSPTIYVNLSKFLLSRGPFNEGAIPDRVSETLAYHFNYLRAGDDELALWVVDGMTFNEALRLLREGYVTKKGDKELFQKAREIIRRLLRYIPGLPSQMVDAAVKVAEQLEERIENDSNRT